MMNRRFDFDDNAAPDPAKMTPEERGQRISEIVLRAANELKALKSSYFLVADTGPQSAMRQWGSIPWALGCMTLYGPALNQAFWQQNSGQGSPFGG